MNSMLAFYLVIAKTINEYGYISIHRAFFKGRIGYISIYRACSELPDESLAQR